MGRIVDISVDPLALQVFNHKTGRQPKNVEPANHSVAVKETRHQRFVPMQREKKNRIKRFKRRRTGEVQLSPLTMASQTSSVTLNGPDTDQSVGGRVLCSSCVLAFGLFLPFFPWHFVVWKNL